MDFDGRLGIGNRRTNFEHVRAENVTAAPQMIGVVLHEGSTTFEAVTHDFHGADKSGYFPVALGAKTETVGHQALNCDSRQLRQPVKVFKGIGECSGTGLSEEMAQAEF